MWGGGDRSSTVIGYQYITFFTVHAIFADTECNIEIDGKIIERTFYNAIFLCYMY